MNAVTRTPGRTLTRLILAGLGAVFGLGVGFGVGRLIKAGALNVEALGWSDMGAAAIAAGLIAMGLFVTVASFSRKAAGRLVDPRGDRPATPGQASFYRQQGLVMFLAGAMMAAPVAAVAAFDPLPAPVASIIMLGIVAAFLVQTAYNITVWRRGDELMRRMISEAGAICFWTLQGLLFLWAAAEKLQLAPALSTWDVMTVLMGVYLAVSSLMAARRGFA